MTLEPGSCYGMEFDGFNDNDKQHITLIEITAQVGKQKGAQPKKICTDVLKLAFARALLQKDFSNANVEAYVVFIDMDAKELLEGKTWPAHAARYFGVTPHLVKIDDGLVRAVRDAKRRQDIRK